MDQIKIIKNTKNTNLKPNNMGYKLDLIQSKKGHMHVGNHARVTNLAFIHFNYQKINTICQNGFPFKTKTLWLNSIKNLLSL